MDAIIILWPLWLIAMLAFAAYAIINHADRIASILKKIDLKMADIAPLFFNGRKFTWFVVSACIAFGFFILFDVSLFISVMRAIKLSVKLF
ncbi:MAG TPA: hypothetical protein VLX68_16265 [Chitinivibrionales bacterium]|nr:hypothetical protein [Chitinivibrionales bacterium]